jgi:hypothetical protein
MGPFETGNLKNVCMGKSNLEAKLLLSEKPIPQAE